MPGEILRLFSEGGGREALARYAVVKGAASPSREAAVWLPLAQSLARVEGEAMDWQVAQCLAAADAGKSQERFGDTVMRAMTMLKSWGSDRDSAALLLLEHQEALRQRFGVSAWDAFWAILQRAFRSQVSPLTLAQALVQGLGYGMAT